MSDEQKRQMKQQLIKTFPRFNLLISATQKKHKCEATKKRFKSKTIKFHIMN